MSKKRQRNAFVDEQAEEDSAEESDTEKKQRVAAMKKLKSNRPSKNIHLEIWCLSVCIFRFVK